VNKTFKRIFGCIVFFSLVKELAQKGDLQAVNLLAYVHALPPVEAHIIGELVSEGVDLLEYWIHNAIL
jgi:hypothetical protein